MGIIKERIILCHAVGFVHPHRPNHPPNQTPIRRSPPRWQATVAPAVQQAVAGSRASGRHLLLAEAPEAAEAAPVADWTLTGNAIPDTTKFVGTTNNQPLIFKTNTSGGGGERMRISAAGDVFIGTQENSGRLTVQTSTEQHAIYGQSTAGFGTAGISHSYVGVYAASLSGVGLLAASLTNYAGFFNGNVQVTGLLEKGGGSFKIDHPLDPENKYLYHSFVESPDMKNIYDGVATLDANGEATVELPAWFEALNYDFRYQLTCVGGFAPVYVAEEIAGNRFRIAGGRQGMKVSWQVTGIRQDAFAQAHRIPVEQDKADEDRGTYLYPAEHGQPETKREQYELVHQKLRDVKARQAPGDTVP